MPKINPNQFKDYVAELKKERFGRNDQLAGKGTNYEDTIDRGLVAETFRACQRSFQAIKTIETQLDTYREALIELFTYDPSLSEMLDPNHNPTSNIPTRRTFSIVNPFIQKLSAICRYYHRTITRQHAGIEYINKRLRNSPDRRLLPLLQKRLLALREELLPISYHFQKELTQFNTCLTWSFQAKRYEKTIDRTGISVAIDNVSTLWNGLNKQGKIADLTGSNDSN